MNAQNSILVSVIASALVLVTPAVRGSKANDGFPLLSGDMIRAVAVTAGAPPLQGEAALARLKEQGQYPSLAQAVQAARYAVETVKSTPDTTPAGACYAGNPAHGLRCWFGASGLELQPGGTKQWKLNLRLQG